MEKNNNLQNWWANDIESRKKELFGKKEKTLMDDLEENAMEKNYTGTVNGFMDWVGGSGHALTKKELIKIIIELDYSTYETVDKKDYNSIIENTFSKLKEI